MNTKKIDQIPVTAMRKMYYNIYTCDLIDLIDNSTVIDKILELQNLFPESNNSNLKTWNSSYKTHLETHIFKKEIDQFLSTANEIIPSKYTRLELLDFWAAIYTKNSYAESHDHDGAKYSFVYYPAADNMCSPLKIEGWLDIQPRPGLFVLFDSLVKHRVPVIKEDCQRMILAGNLVSIPLEFTRVNNFLET